MKNLSQAKLKNKLVLLRVDINSDVKRGKVIESLRIKKAVNTIKFLKKENAKIVILAHQGNPKKSDFISLNQHAKLLSKYTKVTFKEKIDKKELKKLKAKDAVLLENIRFNMDEFKPEKENNSILNFAKNFDLYINDAFSVSHRSHTSLYSIPKVIEGFPGPTLTEELAAIKKIKMRKCLFILGGGKPESNIKLLGKNPVLAAGFFGQVCLISKGKNLGYQNKFLQKNALIKEDFNEFLKKLKRKLRRVITPIDFAILKDSKRKECGLSDFPNNFEIEDIGEKTISLFKEEIKKAKFIYMKGPAGLSSDERFSKGTLEILKAIQKSSAFSIVGGGHLTDTIHKYKLKKSKFGHVSLSGGALLNYLAGVKLPGLVALGFYKK